MKLHELQSALASLAHQPQRAQLLSSPTALANYLRNQAVPAEPIAPDSQESQDAAEADSQEEQAISSMLSEMTPEQVATLAAAAMELHPQAEELLIHLAPIGQTQRHQIDWTDNELALNA